jgi:hypothetical protein
MLGIRVSDLRTIGAWLAREGWAWVGRLREPGLWAAQLAGLVLWILAYQIAPAYVLHVGGDTQTHKRDYDTPFLSDGGFNDSEPGKLKRDGQELQWWEQPDKPPYRWAKDDAAVLLPGLGGRRWAVSILARSGRPGGGAAESRWQIGDDPPVTLSIAAHPRLYTILGDTSYGDLRITMQTQPLVVPGDPRTLGLAIHRVAATPAGESRLRRPALGQIALLSLLLLTGYSLARRLALPRYWALALALIVAAACAAMLAESRLALTIWTPALAWLALICYLLAVLLAPLLAAAVQALGLDVVPSERSAALATSIGAFWLRMAGLLHPYAKSASGDLGFNVNNLDAVIGGKLFLYAGLPAEVGGGKAPYPPAQYLVLAPFRLLFGDDRLQRGWLIQGGNALLESCSAALIWLLLRRMGFGRRAALLGAALYIVIPPLLRSFSIGEFANIFGQSLVVPLLLFLALGAPRAGRWHIALIGAVLLLVILLSHTGVVISTVALLLAWLPLWWLVASSPRSRAGERWAATARRLLAAGAIAGLLALGLFSSSYTGLLEQRQALTAAIPPIAEASAGTLPPSRPFGAKVFGELQSGFSTAKGISPLLALSGGLGLLLLWRRHPLQLGLLLACWLGMLLSMAVLLRSDQAVRWQAFLFPALCMGAAPLFAAWARRGRAGAALALLALIYLAWLGVDLWARQVVNYLH